MIKRREPGHKQRHDAVHAPRSSRSTSVRRLSLYTLCQALSGAIFEKRFLGRICGWLPARVDSQVYDIKRFLRRGRSETRRIFSWSVSPCCSGHGARGGYKAVDMWTTQARCPHAHSHNNRRRSLSMLDLETSDHCRTHNGLLRCPRVSYMWYPSLTETPCRGLRQDSRWPGRAR